MRSRITPILLALTLTSLAFSQTGYRLKMKTAGEYAALQRQIVGNYCRLDFEGSRLSDTTWTKMKPFVRFKQNPDFRVVEVISRYQISPPEGQSSNLVNVTFTLLGRYDIGYGYAPATGTSETTFRVEEKNDELEITSVEPNVPRVSKRALIDWLKKQRESSTNAIEKAQIERSLAALEPPPASSTPQVAK